MTTKLPEVIPVSDLEEDASSVILRLRPFCRTESEREILTLLARGEREIAEGVGYDLDEVLAEADNLLGRHDA